MYRLMIKQHTITKLKYLCITSRENWESYAGSGVRWIKHLKKHGYSFTTELLYESETYGDFLEQCVYFSAIFNVALNEDFANMVPEHGYGEQSCSNVTVWWRYATEEMKKWVIEKRKVKQKKNHWINSDKSDEIKQTLSLYAIERWNQVTVDERREIISRIRVGFRKFYDERGERYFSWKDKLSRSLKDHFANVPFDVISKRNRDARLSLSPQKKEIRKQRIQQVYATGKHDHLYERYSKERQGVLNPAAKIVVWYGNRYSKHQFKQLKLTKEEIQVAFDTRPDCYNDFDETPREYTNIVCPHCLKNSNNKKHSAFRRWHFDHCKQRGINNEDIDGNSRN